MTISYRQIDKIGFFNHRRMIEDLGHTFGQWITARGAATRPPASMLTRLGQDLLNALPGDQGAYDLRYGAVDISVFGKIEYGTAFSGNLPFDCLQAAIIFGRVDLRSKFVNDEGFDFDKALRWYVLHGIREHGLWHTVTPNFIQNLRKPSLILRGSCISPLCAIVLGERPELLKSFLSHGSRSVEDVFLDWLRDEGLSGYGLIWAVSREEQRRLSVRMQQKCRDYKDKIESINCLVADHGAIGLSDLREISARINSVLQGERERPCVLTQKEDGLDRLVVQGGTGDISRLGVPLYSEKIKIGIPHSACRTNFLGLQISCYAKEVGGIIKIVNEGKILTEIAMKVVDNVIVVPVTTGAASAFQISCVEIHYCLESGSVQSGPWAHLRRVWLL